MQHETSQHAASSSGFWITLLILFGPSALTLWWVIHQASS